MPPKKRTAIIGVRVPIEVKEKLQRMSRNGNISELVRKIIEDYIEKSEER